MVAGGGSPRVVLAGLRFGEALLEPGASAGRGAPASGSSRCGCPTTTGVDIAVERVDACADRPGAGACSSRTTRACGSIVARHLRGHGLRGRGGRVRGGRGRGARTAACGPPLVLLDLNLPGTPAGTCCASAALDGRRLAARRHHQRDDGQPAAPRGVRRAPAICPSPSRSRRWSRPIERARSHPTGGPEDHSMTDLQIVLIMVAASVVFAGYLVLCERVRG